MTKLTSTTGRKTAGGARPRKATGKKRMVVRAGAKRKLRRQSRRTPGKRGWRLAFGKRIQRRTRPLQPSRGGPLVPDSAFREERLKAPVPPPAEEAAVPPPAEEAPSPHPAGEAAYADPASDPDGMPHPQPPEPLQAAAPQPADDTLWRLLLSRVPASYSLPDGVVVEALQHALGR